VPIRIVKQSPFCCIVLIAVFSLVPSYAQDRGPVAAFSYSPIGTGYLYLPGPNGNNGADKTKPDSTSRYTSSTRLFLSGGYYYDFLQADLSYTRLTVDDQKSDYSADDSLLSGSDSSFVLRFGSRFSIPGDTSYSWLYLGLKRYSFSSSSRGVDVTAYGYLAGYSGFYSFGLSSDYEFVLALDAYLGTYRFDRLSTDIDYRNVSKRYSVSVGGGVGIGVQYEPYNTALLLKLSSDYNRIAYDMTFTGRNRKISVGNGAFCVGLEVRYSLPSVTYNERKK